jgi:hypothetical protein
MKLCSMNNYNVVVRCLLPAVETIEIYLLDKLYWLDILIISKISISISIQATNKL